MNFMYELYFATAGSHTNTVLSTVDKNEHRYIQDKNRDRRLANRYKLKNTGY